MHERKVTQSKSIHDRVNNTAKVFNIMILEHV